MHFLCGGGSINCDLRCIVQIAYRQQLYESPDWIAKLLMESDSSVSGSYFSGVRLHNNGAKEIHLSRLVQTPERI